MENLRRIVALCAVLLGLNLAAFGAGVGSLGAPSQGSIDPPIVVEGEPGPRQQNADALSYVMTNLTSKTFLRADGSGVLYLENTIRNDSQEPMTSHTWCFYWGQDKYRHVFAKDRSGFITVNYYENFSNDYNTWGMCVEVPFRQAVRYGESYWFAQGITIDSHHSVIDDVITAQWSVRSAASIDTYTEKVSWPFNHEAAVVDPPPDILGPSYAQWTRTNAQTPWQFTVNLRITLGDQMAVTALSQGTLPYNGVDHPWEDDAYGVNTGKTIGDWGCYLTSCTMAMSYYGDVLGVYGYVDPGTLNAWLKKPRTEGETVPRGYGRDDREDPPGFYGLVDPSIMDEASQSLYETTGYVIVPGSVEQPTRISDLRDNILNGELGVLNVDNGGYGHFVLVTGYYTTENNVGTVYINDPYENRGSTTLLAQYGNQYGSVRWFRRGDETVRPTYVTLYADCPVELLITDSSGRRAGYDPRTGRRYDEIPGSAYVIQYNPMEWIATSEGTKILQVETYERSEYQVQVIGTGTGTYSIRYTADLASGETDTYTHTGTTRQGQVDNLTVVYDPNTGIDQYLAYLPLLLRQHTPRFATLTATPRQTLTPTPTYSRTPTRTATATRTPTRTATPDAAWGEEAEAGQLLSPMSIGQDEEASGGQFITSAVRSQGTAQWEVTLASGGSYYLWARAKGPDEWHNSFFVSIDGAAEIFYEVPCVGDQWIWGWSRVHEESQPENPFALAAGRHSIRFRAREEGAQLDALLLTANPAYTP